MMDGSKTSHNRWELSEVTPDDGDALGTFSVSLIDGPDCFKSIYIGKWTARLVGRDTFWPRTAK